MSWVTWAIITAIVIALQLFPLTGVFFLIFGGPLWSIFFINMTFLIMALNVWSGRSDRALLALPILWFGGYAIATTISHVHAYQFDAAIADANAAKRLDFVKDSQDILIEPDRISDSRKLSHELLVRDFNVNRAYQFVRDGIQEAAVIPSPCPTDQPTKSALYWRNVGDGHYRASNLCLRFSLSKPPQPHFRIKVHEAVNRSGLTNTMTQQIDIVTPDEKSVSLLSGRSRPLSWLPMPMIGCVLMGTGSGWDCTAMMLRENFGRNVEIPNSQIAVFARAFGLTKVSMRERYPDAEWINAATGRPPDN